MNKFAQLFLLLVCISSLTAVARDIDPRKLARSSEATTYVLTAQYSSETTVGRSRAAYVLLAGTYVRAFETNQGYYLAGGENSLEVRVVTPRRKRDPVVEIIERQGAIFVPFDPARGATLLFFLPEGPSERVGHHTALGIANSTASNSPIAAGVGAGIASALINSYIAARAGKMVIPKGSKPDLALTGLIVRQAEH
ncbi:hypothetical protein VC218_11465 [Xanthomonas nasturtii]|uniref:hypothetical protein n=1 Tax=Xanthomonas nasturtii TaxID=1843581 RepID=UPI002B23E194|nr:hypothetical protein [Xanthomonas nasturtii]MEA9579504.1 hypothetical protein [Xanthomonas nasturtii]